MLCIGCHLSASGGYLAMGKQALKMGANTFQFFTRNPRGGTAKPLNMKDVEAFLELSRENNIGKLVAHAPYTLNLCSADEGIMEFAKNTFIDDLERLEFTPGNYYNFHPGSHVKQGVDVGIEKICAALDVILERDWQTTVLLETMAGKGSEIGRSFEELRTIIDNTKYGYKLGVCLDTCHIYDGGYDIVNNLDAVLDEFDRVVGLDRLKALHLNDSKNPMGSHKDRHEKIGDGSIGIDTFRQIVNHPLLKTKPMELETPNDLDGYEREIALLRSLEEQ